MTPWRKRLNDYRQLLRQVEATYFEPNLFRLNLNSAIQTSRTVTFLIQKGKASIPEFDSWYRSHVIDATRGDRVMEWLKNSRNIIEKQGDLDTLSECALELLFSYTDRGPTISAKREGLMGAGIKKLLRFGRKTFPTGIFRDSAVIVDRRWVADSLPDWEVTDALHYGCSVLRRIVDDLDTHVGAYKHVHVLENRFAVGSAARRAYVKTDDGRVYFLASKPTLQVDPDVARKRYGETVLRQVFSNGDFRDTFDQLVEVACSMFNTDSTHVTIAFAFDDACRLSGIWPVHFADHADKLIFWSHLAHMAAVDQSIWGVIFISEFWRRSLDEFPEKRVSELKITGEGLHIVGASKANHFLMKSIPIARDEKNALVNRELMSAETAFPNFLVPLRRAWGLPEWKQP